MINITNDWGENLSEYGDFMTFTLTPLDISNCLDVLLRKKKESYISNPTDGWLSGRKHWS